MSELLEWFAEEVLRQVFEDEDVYERMVQVLDNTAQQSRTARLWIDYLVKPLMIMMLFIRTERDGNWPLHLLAAESMLVYFLSDEYWNYVRLGYNTDVQFVWQQLEETYVKW